ncbi:hypothetical protein E2C01_087117 [Portunus trituberculatus]|uniref:Uncharacterized protein n=1 Tax=Portunus trituberculatus TaxID=210409 RepID=A0A5B7JD75_PORTR|nr:hypothetical protein [Portunus trituberculatus]
MSPRQGKEREAILNLLLNRSPLVNRSATRWHAAPSPRPSQPRPPISRVPSFQGSRRGRSKRLPTRVLRKHTLRVEKKVLLFPGSAW